MIREASLYERLGDGRVKCHVCAHTCIISPDKIGICRTRQNREGKLYTLIYALVTSENIDPVEKKPLYHFYPGSRSYSLGSAGCNFRCQHCQNWTISQISVDEAYAREIPPEQAVDNARRHGCTSISFTYNEPAIWHEYAYDVSRLAKKKGLKTIYVTNGFITHEALDEMSGYLDAFRVDIKSMDDGFYRDVCKARLSPVLDSTKHAKELGMHIEVVNLMIPGLNDAPDKLRELVRWVRDNIGAATPVHFTRFYPMYKMTHIQPTPVETLENAYRIAKEEGLRFPYVGNVWNVGGHKYESTFCPKCDNVLIQRSGYNVNVLLRAGEKKCPKCGEEIEIVL